ncbi:Golgi-associated plant pathogenesis-related protein 1-like [Symsagittifera roscoffensis]|uniref:Golgi-associated plant pathogenesis-related protein 1-like n=1 Tax=Symsagittifera roscoffensis TaxID=84072 RepID=UPI00307B9B25
MSKKAGQHAQQWAQHLASNNEFQHSNNKEYGENIASHWDSSGKQMSGREVADMWYKECSNYDYSKGDYIRGTGHFTQMVWKNSRKVGIGTAVAKDGKMIVVANYKPPGNIIGEFKDNVLPPKKK